MIDMQYKTRLSILRKIAFGGAVTNNKSYETYILELQK